MFPLSSGVVGPEKTGENVAANLLAPPAEPMQFGPTKRIPDFLAIASNSSWASAPASSASAKPEDITIATPTSASAQSWTASLTKLAGTIIKARSIFLPIFFTFSNALSPRTSPPLGFTGNISPANPYF